MAEFTLSIKTEDAAELRGIVDRIAGVVAVESNMLGSRRNVVERAEPLADGGELPANQAYPAAESGLTTYATGVVTHMAAEQIVADSPEVTVTNNTDAVVTGVDMAAEGGDYSVEVTIAPDRDKHGIKRDERIHANAAEPFKADGTWKRRKNLTDDQYDSVYLELVREAQAAGVYAGPVVPELELEARVEDAAPSVGQPAVVAPAPVAAAAPAPQAAAPAPAAGMSAQATPTPNAVVMKLMPLAGPAAFPALFTALGVPNIMNFSPEQLRLADDVATALRDRIESEGALVTNAAGAVSSSPEWKAANPNALIETAQLFGLV